ncbi:transcriptional regulator swi6, partial [Ascosphaera aggregata]
MAHTAAPERPLHQRGVAARSRQTEEGQQKNGDDQESSYRQHDESEQAQQPLHDRHFDHEAAAPSSSPTSSIRPPAPAVSISMPPPSLSIPGPTAGAIAGSHRESFSRTPVRGSLQSGTALLENDIEYVRRDEEYGSSQAQEQQPVAARSQSDDQSSPKSRPHTQLQTRSQLSSQQADLNDAAASLDSLTDSSVPSARSGAVNVFARSGTSTSPRSQARTRQYDDRTRREQAMDYGPGRGHSESYTKLWRDYHNSHEDNPSKHATAAAPDSSTSMSVQGGDYENGHRRADDYDYQGASSSTQPHQQHEQQQYPDPRVSSSTTSLSGSHRPLSDGADYDHHEEDEGDHDQDNIEEYERPQIWTAVYSNVSVYETIVNSIAVMRRRTDSWLNATQILKVAGVPKARRTKILQALEREVDPSKHEKVQGGYGKYQGTWVEFERGREICREWGVENILRPLLELKGEKWDGYNEAYGYPYTQGFAAGFPTKHVKGQHAQQQR